MSGYKNLKRDQIVTQYPFTPFPNENWQQSTLNVAQGAVESNVPKGVFEVMVQALDQNIRYSLDDPAPTNTTGFRMTAGAVPIVIPIVQGRTRLRFAAEADGATLVLQWGE